MGVEQTLQIKQVNNLVNVWCLFFQCLSDSEFLKKHILLTELGTVRDICVGQPQTFLSPPPEFVTDQDLVKMGEIRHCKWSRF